MFWLLIILVFTSGPGGMTSEMAQREAMPLKFEPTAEACQAEAKKILSIETPAGVYIGVKCDGPLLDPTTPKVPT